MRGQETLKKQKEKRRAEGPAGESEAEMPAGEGPPEAEAGPEEGRPRSGVSGFMVHTPHPHPSIGNEDPSRTRTGPERTRPLETRTGTGPTLRWA